MPPEWYGYVMEKLLAAGALDVYFAPVQMKKNRPGTLLTVICRPQDAGSLGTILLAHTTTLGVRRQDVQRLSLPRVAGVVDTRFGPIAVKVAALPDGKRRVAPEYEACRQAAEAHDASLWEVYQAALAAAVQQEK